jgi:C2 domain
MSKTLTIISAKCIRPATGMDGSTTKFIEDVAKLVPGNPVPPGLLSQLDHTFSGQDDFYVKLSGSKVYPIGHKYKALHSQQTAQINVSAPLTKALSIELWEYDSVSSDDFMGRVTVPTTATIGKHTQLVASKAEGSLYEVTYSVS